MQEVMTKDREIEIVSTFYNSLPEDSYLKIILKGMPEYCEEQIRNDWAINPLEELRECDSKIKIAKQSESQFKIRNEQLENELKLLKEDWSRIYDERQEEIEQNEELGQINLRLNDIERLENDVIKAQSRTL